MKKRKISIGQQVYFDDMPATIVEWTDHMLIAIEIVDRTSLGTETRQITWVKYEWLRFDD